MTRVTIVTDGGPYEVRAQVLDEAETFAVHETTGLHMLAPRTLTHLPTGRAVLGTIERGDAVKIGRHLLRIAKNGEWSSGECDVVEAAVPREVQFWLKACWEKRAFVPPDSTAAQPQQEKRMPKMTKDQLAQQKLENEREAKKLANKLVEKARRAIKPPAKDEIAQGWWVALKADVAAALVSFKG